MDDHLTFSFRIPRELAAAIKTAAKQLGINRSEYARRALEQFQAQHLQDRMAELSRRVARQSAEAAGSMEGTITDGLA